MVSHGSSVTSSASPGGGIIPGKLGRLGNTSYTSGPGPGQKRPMTPSQLANQGRFSLSNTCQEFQEVLKSSPVGAEIMTCGAT